MDIRQVDVAVIGAGTAGLGARREAERQGASVVLIESGPYGTMCARVGCMPSKLLIAAADAAHEVAGASRFGIELAGPARVRGPAVLERVRRERDRFVGFVVDDTQGLPPEQRLRGRAHFLGASTLQIDDHTRVEAKAVVIAAGSSPMIPALLDPVREYVLVNDDVFELEDLPESVAVIGLGIVGLELGQALHRLGVRVRLFGRSRIGPHSDPEVQRRVHEVLSGELSLHLGADLEARPDPDGGVRLAWRSADGSRGEERFERALAATGRRPNLADLGLEVAGVPPALQASLEADPHTMQIGDLPVFLAGDVTGERALLHEAADEGRIAGYNAAHYPHVIAHRRRVPLSIVFSDPQIAVVGTPYAELDLDAVEIGAASYDDQGRARVMGKNAGLVRVYAERGRGTLLGAEMFGPRVEHTAHLLAWAVQSGLSADRALELPFYHPVVEEGIRTALRDLAARLGLAEPPCARELDCGPGV